MSNGPLFKTAQMSSLKTFSSVRTVFLSLFFVCVLSQRATPPPSTPATKFRDVVFNHSTFNFSSFNITPFDVFTYVDNVTLSLVPQLVFSFVSNYFYSLVRVILFSSASLCFLYYLLFRVFRVAFRLPCFFLKLFFRGCNRRCCRVIRRLPRVVNDFSYLTPSQREELHKLLDLVKQGGETPSVGAGVSSTPSPPDLASPHSNTLDGLPPDVAPTTVDVIPPVDTLASCMKDEQSFANIATDACMTVIKVPWSSPCPEAEQFNIIDRSLTTAAYVATIPAGAAFNRYFSAFSTLVAASPRFKKLITRFAHVRFDSRIIIVPSNAIGITGVVKFDYDNNNDPTYTPPVNSNRAWNATCPQLFYSLGDTKHVAFEIPFPFNCDWLEGGYFPDAGGYFNCTNFTPIATATGAATTVSFDIYLAFDKVYGRCPIGQAYNAQGLVDIKNITIDSIRDSTLPMNMRGDEIKLEAPNLPIGLDNPADTRSFQRVHVALYSKRKNKGDVDLTRATFNNSDLSFAPIEGLDEMSISALMEMPQLVDSFNISTATVPGTKMLEASVVRTPDTANRGFINGTLQWHLWTSCTKWAADSIRLHIIKPAASFMTGKLLLIYSPSNFSNGTTFTFANNFKTNTGLDVFGFPGMLIDLSNMETESVLEFPCVSTSKGIMSPLFSAYRPIKTTNAGVQKFGGQYAIYCVMAPSPTVTIPTTTTIRVSMSFKNFRMIYPLNSPYDTLSIQSARVMASVPSDPVPNFWDDALSVKQFAMQYYHLSVVPIKTVGLYQRFDMNDVIKQIPVLRWYSRFTGSIRLRITMAERDNNPTDGLGLKFNVFPYVPNVSVGIENAWRSQVAFENATILGPPNNDYIPSGGTVPISGNIPIQQTSTISAPQQYVWHTPMQVCVSQRSPEAILEIPIITAGKWLDVCTTQQFVLTAVFNNGFPTIVPADPALTASVKFEVSVGDDFRAFGLVNKYNGSADAPGSTTSVVNFPLGTAAPPIPGPVLPH